MDFETFLEDYDWFDKTKKQGSSYLHPVKRNIDYVEPDWLSGKDKMYFMDSLEEFEDENPNIRKDIQDYKGAYKASDILKELIFKTTLNRDYTVYRAFGGKIDITKMKPGDILPNKSGVPISTSLKWQVSSLFRGKQSTFKDNSGNHIWLSRIVIPKGKNGFYIDAIENHNDNEKELLLPETTKFKVTGFSYVMVKVPSSIHLNDNVHFVDCIAV